MTEGPWTWTSIPAAPKEPLVALHRVLQRQPQKYQRNSQPGKIMFYYFLKENTKSVCIMQRGWWKSSLVCLIWEQQVFFCPLIVSLGTDFDSLGSGNKTFILLFHRWHRFITCFCIYMYNYNSNFCFPYCPKFGTE